jgi:type I restriction enzyme S subunit
VSKWREQTITDIAAPSRNALVGGPFGSNLVSRDYTLSGVPVIRGQNMGFERWVSGEFVFVSEDKAEDLSANIARPGDLVFTQRGTLGQVAIVPPAPFDRYIISQSQMKLTVDPTKADTKFIFYFFTSEEQQDYIRRNAIQTGVPHTNLGHLRTTPLLLPPLPEQRAIAAVLGSLDDKIELNRRMNATLEALAQSLFKSWFVDAPLRQGYGGQATQSALPKGWRAGTLGEVAENPRRGIQPDEIKTDTAYIGLEHMPRRSIALSDWGHTEELESGKFEFNRGEILFGKLRPYFHKVGVAPLDGVCSTDILVITPKEPAWFGFVLGYVSSVELVNHTNAASTGTKMPRANWNDISRYEVALPPKQLAADFTEKTRPLVERIIANIHESRTLAALRDALLPKLLSGELRVPAALPKLEASA